MLYNIYNKHSLKHVIWSWEFDVNLIEMWTYERLTIILPYKILWVLKVYKDSKCHFNIRYMIDTRYML